MECRLSWPAKPVFPDPGTRPQQTRPASAPIDLQSSTKQPIAAWEESLTNWCRVCVCSSVCVVIVGEVVECMCVCVCVHVCSRERRMDIKT